MENMKNKQFNKLTKKNKQYTENSYPEALGRKKADLDSYRRKPKFGKNSWLDQD